MVYMDVRFITMCMFYMDFCIFTFNETSSGWLSSALGNQGGTHAGPHGKLTSPGSSLRQAPHGDKSPS